jgi:hypothetical protein
MDGGKPAQQVGNALVLGFGERFAQNKHAFRRVFPSPVGRPTAL